MEAHAAATRADASARPRPNNKAKARRCNSGQGPPTPLQRRRVKHQDEKGSYQRWLARKNTPQLQRGATRSTASGAHPANQTTIVAPTHHRDTSVANSKAPPITPCARLSPRLTVPNLSIHTHRDRERGGFESHPPSRKHRWPVLQYM